ncbi:MAG: FAD-binding oxidoreductase [Planctomycetota bacterium]
MPIRRLADAWMETHNTRTLRFDFRDDPIDFLPGQFIMTHDWFKGYDKPVKRAYSIASSPLQKDFVDITVKREVPGLMSIHLTEIPVGYEMEVSGPNGKYHYEPSQGKKVLLLGAGSGVTPLHSIARYVLDSELKDAKVMLFYSVKTPRDIIYEKLWPEMTAKHPNFKFHLTVTRARPEQWSGRHGRIASSWIREKEGDVSDAVAFICGPGPMVESMEQVCRELSIPDSRINTEKW